MTDPVDTLLGLLDIERLEVDLFRGQPEDGTSRQRLFGGHVIAQALVAAYQTVEDRPCHSLHGYFIRPGDPTIPVVYEVDRARDGGSFTTRRVIAIQHGRQILNLAASFHRPEEAWDHQHPMPDVPGPEGLESQEARRLRLLAAAPEDRKNHYATPRPVEVREVDPIDQLDPVAKSDVNHLWFRIPRPLEAEPWMHHCLMAYATDLNLLSSGLRRHAVSWLQPHLMGASLDHAVWFHGPIRFDEWHLYAMDSPFAGGGRSFNRGSIFTRDGALVASVAQEGLMRKIKPKQ